MTAEQLQSYLMQRTVADSPDAWPGWLIALTLAWLGLCALLTLHALLHRRLCPRQRSGATLSASIFTRVSCGCGTYSMRCCSCFCCSAGCCSTRPRSPAATRWLVRWHPYAGYLLLGLWCGFILLNALGANGVHYRIRWRGSRRAAGARPTFTCSVFFAPHRTPSTPAQRKV
ncbi:hypothetical protein O0544_09310 [Edwardsiella anguillarum]|nr:hypothetical protein [Edwardsiella anguillarum]